MMESPHDITLSVDAIEQFQRERNRIDDLIEAFGRRYNVDLGQPISDQSFLIEWELHAGNIHATYEYSDQCGGGKEYARFPAAALSDPAARAEALAEDKAKIEAEAEKKRQQKIAAARAELDRAADRLTEAQGYNVQQQADGTHAVFLGQGFVRGGFKERWEALSFARDLADAAEEAGVPAVA